MRHEGELLKNVEGKNPGEKDGQEITISQMCKKFEIQTYSELKRRLQSLLRLTNSMMMMTNDGDNDDIHV